MWVGFVVLLGFYGGCLVLNCLLGGKINLGEGLVEEVRYSGVRWLRVRNVSRVTGTWDLGLKFEDILQRLLDFKKVLRERAKVQELGPKLRKQLAKVNILILQLVNGMRISEAIECYYRFLEEGKRELMIKAGKSDRYRLCVIPPAIDSVDVKLTRGLPRPTPSLVWDFARVHFNINTHGLRYAFINHMLEKGVDPVTVGKMLAYKKLDTLLTYVQQRRAHEELLSLARKVKIGEKEKES